MFAWPTAEIAVMGAEGAVEVVFRNEISKAADKKAKRQEMIDLYRNTFSNPYVAGCATARGRHHRAGRDRKCLAVALESSTPSANCGRRRNTG